MNELERYREEIDAIDAQIIELLARRRDCVDGITGVKLATDLKAHQPERMNQVISSRRQLATQNNLDPGVIEAIWRLLIAYFTQLEEEALNS